MASKMVHTLAHRIDALTVAYRVEIAAGLWAHMLALREEAGDTDGGRVEMRLAGQPFALEKRGAANGYQVRLVNADATILVGDQRSFDDHGNDAGPGWTVEVTFRAVWLARNRLSDAKAWARIFARHLSYDRDSDGQAIIPERIRRVDLCADLETHFETSDRSSFVGKAKKAVDYRQDAAPIEVAMRTHWSKGRDTKLNGFSFAMGAPFSARLYDKTEELRRYEPDHEKWIVEHGAWNAGGWLGGTVWRLEFQVRREALEELTISRFEDLELRLDGLWQYGVHDWLRLVVRDTATRKRRAEIDERWLPFQAVVFVVESEPTKRERGKRGGVKYAQVMGTLLSFSASSGALPELVITEERDNMAQALALQGFDECIRIFRDRFVRDARLDSAARSFIRQYESTAARFATLDSPPVAAGS